MTDAAVTRGRYRSVGQTRHGLPGGVAAKESPRLDIFGLDVVERSSVVVNLRELVVGLWHRRLRRILVPVRR